MAKIPKRRGICQKIVEWLTEVGVADKVCLRQKFELYSLPTISLALAYLIKNGFVKETEDNKLKIGDT
jgi:hypothetical protein